ncbi:MAG: hypothetical protein ACTSP2_03660, partial [Alphaproteobacteria bacterium]
RATELMTGAKAESSTDVAARIVRARALQAQRYAADGLAGVTTNARCPAAALDHLASPDGGAARLLREAAEAMCLSARGYHRVLKVARTLADLDGADAIGRLHMAEALSYRAVGNGMALAA